MNEIVKTFQTIGHSLSSTDWVVISGILATALHYFLGRFKDFATMVNYLLALVFPFVTVLATSLLSAGSPLAKYPTAFLVAQTVYHLVEWLKNNAVAKAVDTPATF